MFKMGVKIDGWDSDGKIKIMTELLLLRCPRSKSIIRFNAPFHYFKTTVYYCVY